jgi:hypothetical protein
MNFGWNQESELLNGRLAMVGIMLAMASELMTGTLTFGLF